VCVLRHTMVAYPFLSRSVTRIVCTTTVLPLASPGGRNDELSFDFGHLELRTLDKQDMPDTHPTTEVDRPSRPTGYIPTPANANFALGSDAVRGQMKVLCPATKVSKSH